MQTECVLARAPADNLLPLVDVQGSHLVQRPLHSLQGAPSKPTLDLFRLRHSTPPTARVKKPHSARTASAFLSLRRILRALLALGTQLS